MEVDKQLYEEIKEYCSLNGLKPREFTNSLLRKAFIEEKFGKAPPFFNISAREIVENKPMSSPEPPAEEENVREEQKVAETTAGSRHDVAENVAKQEKNEKNDAFSDKNETITTKTAVLEKTTPENEVKQESKKQTIKKRKL